MTKLTTDEILDELSYQAALAEADHGTSTRDDVRRSRELGDKLQMRLAQLRRNLLPAAVPIQKTKPIRAKWLGLDRVALIAKLTEITQAMSGAVQYAHRDLQGLSDNDLRQLLDLLDTSPRD
ncbi:MAG TPA: hypothetical protein VIV40_06915 [Kofleriaceae bacterium]